MPRLGMLVRQTKVFELVVAGKTYGEICKQLKVSEDTVARDMRAVASQVEDICRERASEILAVAIAQVAEVRAWAEREYLEDRRREKAWYAGKLDYLHEDVNTKTLAREDADETGLPAITDESGAIEVKRVVRRVRPPFQSSRTQYLNLMRQCALDLVELCGIKKVLAAPRSDGTLTIEVTYADD